MYGDSESCDSTIKLGEFCSWRGVVPLTLAPSFATPAPLAPFPFRRSAVIYDLIRLIFPATPNSIVLSLVFLASARTPKTTSPFHPFHSVKDSRIARPRTPASRLLLAVAISGIGSIFYQSDSRNTPKSFFPFIVQDEIYGQFKFEYIYIYYIDLMFYYFQFYNNILINLDCF